jgi:hypothetical protein
MKIDLCPNRADYYSQLNNEINPAAACQVTSMVAGLGLVFHNLGPIKRAAKFNQPEDCLYHYICDDRYVQEFYKRNHLGSTIPVPEWADVLVYAVNRLYERGIVYFDGSLYPEKIITDLHSGLPVMVSMQYPDNKPKPIPGHYVLVIGLEDNDFLINDPYKNCLTGDTNGYQCVYTHNDWRKHSKGYGIRFNRV